MTRDLEVDEEAAEEAEAQVRYYNGRAGTQVALRFAAEIEAIYVGLVEGRFVGVNHPRVESGLRLPVHSDSTASSVNLGLVLALQRALLSAFRDLVH